MTSKLNYSEQTSAITRDKSQSWCKSSGDRFIPHRISVNSNNFDMLPIKELICSNDDVDTERQYGEFLRTSLSNLDKYSSGNKLFTYNYNSRKLSNPEPVKLKKMKSKTRRRSKFSLPKQPYKVLEAPGLEDNFYLSLMDWSKKDRLAISLENTVYIFDVKTGQMNKVYEAFECESTTSLKWDITGKRLAIGNVLGQVTIWDLEKDCEYDVIENHEERVGTIDWGLSMLTGSKDGMISKIDLRQPDVVNYYKEHEGEVCKVKWSPDECFFASGGNDNKMCVWSTKNKIPLMKESHNAAIKALGWSVKQYGMLASGGGSNDMCLKVWNTSTREMTASRNTNSQICDLVFSKKSNDIITCHGYPDNEITIWRAKGLKKVGSLTGHSERVLYSALSPCGENFASASPDETLRFWRLYCDDLPPVEEIKSVISSSSLLR